MSIIKVRLYLMLRYATHRCPPSSGSALAKANVRVMVINSSSSKVGQTEPHLLTSTTLICVDVLSGALRSRAELQEDKESWQNAVR